MSRAKSTLSLSSQWKEESSWRRHGSLYECDEDWRWFGLRKIRPSQRYDIQQLHPRRLAPSGLREHSGATTYRGGAHGRTWSYAEKLGSSARLRYKQGKRTMSINHFREHYPNSTVAGTNSYQPSNTGGSVWKKWLTDGHISFACTKTREKKENDSKQ